MASAFDTVRKFEAVAARIDLGSTGGERTAARNVGRKMIRKYGLRACVPSHPLNKIDGFALEIVEVLEAAWNPSIHCGGTFELSQSERVAMWAGLEAFGAKELGRAYRIIRNRKRAGWTDGKWTGGNDLKFLGVVEWPLKVAFRATAAMDGFEPDEAERFLAA